MVERGKSFASFNGTASTDMTFDPTAGLATVAAGVVDAGFLAAGVDFGAAALAAPTDCPIELKVMNARVIRQIDLFNKARTS